MGAGSYRASDWTRLKASRKIDSGSTEQIFTRSSMNSKFDPRYIEFREARDSEEHPNSTPIMIGVDVTGSMGYLSSQIIKESLNELMMQLYSKKLVEDPQLLFAAIGDAVVDRAPLQVTQFESDIRIAEQLMDLWLEERGGDAPEDYELLWYFAARHTDIDSYNKRGKKGFCFTIGDADCHDFLSKSSVNGIFGDKVKEDLVTTDLAAMASEKYELFHIVIGEDAIGWPNILPGRVLIVTKTEIKYLPEIMISTMQIANGSNPDDVLMQWGELARVVVKRAISLLCIDNKDEIQF